MDDSIKLKFILNYFLFKKDFNFFEEFFDDKKNKLKK
jgi:hypothetical protein